MADDDREARAREAVRRVLRKVPWLVTKEGNREIFCQWLKSKDLPFVVQAARAGHAEAIDILRDYLRVVRHDGMSIPAELQEFALDWFQDGPPKAPPGPKPQDTVTRDQTIIALVKIVHEDFGFSISSNPEWRGDKAGPMTAFRLVGEEIGLNERTVEDIWDKGKPSILPSVKFGG
jgi:hypothetical protein